jgi:hypothetical protein
MQGRGMALTGPSIVIDRGANLLTMQGSGEMEGLLDHDLENRPLGRPGTLHITWLKEMTFDGRKAHFQDDVKVSGEAKLLGTAWLDVYLQHPISFSGPQPQQQQQQQQVERVACGGGVDVVNQTFEAGQQVSCDHIHLKNLDMNNVSGDFHGDGPGRVISVRRGGNQAFNIPGGSLAGQAQPRPAAFTPAQPPADPSQLTCLDLQFMRSITGNKNRKELVFHGNVKAAHAAAQSWATRLEDDDPKHLGPQAITLHSESLEIADMSPVAGSSGGNLELQARDDVRVEGTNFRALCARLSYSQAKDQLIFEGNGRSDAELYKQEVEGGEVQPFKAQKILYFLKTGQANVDGFRALQINPGQGGPMPGVR